VQPHLQFLFACLAVVLMPILEMHAPVPLKGGYYMSWKICRPLGLSGALIMQALKLPHTRLWGNQHAEQAPLWKAACAIVAVAHAQDASYWCVSEVTAIEPSTLGRHWGSLLLKKGWTHFMLCISGMADSSLALLIMQGTGQCPAAPPAGTV
jgi:hypothetical protein